MDSYFIIGEMFLEYLNGACKENEEIRTLCDFCSTREECCEEIERVARRFPTTKVVGIIIFLSSKNPTNNRFIDNYMHATGVAEQQHTHQVNAPWMTPAVSQQNLLRLRDAWKTIWNFWQCWVLRKIKGRRKDWLRKARRTKSMAGMGYSKMVPLVSRQKHVLTNTWSVMSFPLHQTRVESLYRCKGTLLNNKVQDSTQEEENPPCNSEDEEESLSFDEEDDENKPCRDWLESRRW